MLYFILSVVFFYYLKRLAAHILCTKCYLWSVFILASFVNRTKFLSLSSGFNENVGLCPRESQVSCQHGLYEHLPVPQVLICRQCANAPECSSAAETLHWCSAPRGKPLFPVSQGCAGRLQPLLWSYVQRRAERESGQWSGLQGLHSSRGTGEVLEFV